MSYLYKQPSVFSDTVIRHYWSEASHDRTEYLQELVDRLDERGVPQTVHIGWEDCDLDAYPHGWTRLKVCTVQEDHAGGKRLIRSRIQLCPNAQMGWALGLLIALELTALAAWPMLWTALALGALLFLAWREGLARQSYLVEVSDEAAAAAGLLAIRPVESPEPEAVQEVAVPVPLQPEPVPAVPSSDPKPVVTREPALAAA